MDFNGFKYLMYSAASSLFAWYTAANWVGVAQGVAVIFSTLAAIGFAVKVVYDAMASRQKFIKAKRDNEKLD